MKTLRSIAVLGALLGSALPAAAETFFIGAYPDKILVVDADSGSMQQQIKLASGLPRGMLLSADGKRIYVSTITTSGIEVIDVATRKVVNSFGLNTPNVKYRFSGGVPDPAGRFFYTMIQKIEKLNDRYIVGPNQFAAIDLQKKAIARTADVPKEDDADPRSGAGGRSRFMISPDGAHLYILRDKMLVVSTADLTVTDRIEVTKPEGTGMESVSFGGNIEALRNPNEYVSLFNAEDPYIRNKIYGVGRINLTSRAFDFRPIGPAPTGMAGLEVSPDMKEGWTVVTHGTTGNKRCEFWHLDLTTNLVKNKAEFPCRSRFNFGISRDGSKLYIFGATYDVEIYGAQSLAHERTIDLGHDTTSAGLIAVE